MAASKAPKKSRARAEPGGTEPYFLDAAGAKQVNLALKELEHRGWKCIGSFIRDVFAPTTPGEIDHRNPSHRQKIVAFLGPTRDAQSMVKADEIVEILYSHKYGSPKAVRNSKNRSADEAKRPDRAKMAQGLLEEWAIKKVESVVSSEADSSSSKDSHFHLSDRIATWDFILNFSMMQVLALAESRAPIVLRLLLAIAFPSKTRPKPQAQLAQDVPAPPVQNGERECEHDGATAEDAGGDGGHNGAMPMDVDEQIIVDTAAAPSADGPEPPAEPPSVSTPPSTASTPPAPMTYATHFSKPAPSGTGNNRRDPFTILLIAFMLLLSARNLHFSAFRKMIGVWLFAHTSRHGVYAVLSRFGFSASYTSVLKFLHALSNSAQSKLRDIARLRAFLLIYDNINRMFRAWDPELGQGDKIHNGTAATFVELDDCDPEKAFNLDPLRHAHQEKRRAQLTYETLHHRINHVKINTLLALHCLSFLVDEVPSLDHHRPFIKLRFRTMLAAHRMRRGRQTKFHPMASSDFNEGNTAENAKVLHDLLITQLGLPEDEVAKVLTIVAGDQSTIEKLRTLKKFLASCPHGYRNYGWVLPLIQLWHMGWSDLERIINTHWGSEINDVSSFCSTNIILGRKVKKAKRPDYYPAQHLVFDNLKIEIVDCWRKLLGEKDLEKFFSSNPMPIEDLLKHADQLVFRYCSLAGYMQALYPDDSLSEFFDTGKPWSQNDGEEPIEGDQVLANGILRRRDSLLHYEFQYAVADGDIGRAMNIMAVWVFTFAGSGRHKYTNELLELACNFEFEYSPELKKAVLNNWLCNLSGIEGCWFPMDLLQEKLIRQLKKMSERADATFGGHFYREIVSINVRAFLDAMTAMMAAVGLGEKGGSHRREKKVAASKELQRKIEDEELNAFRAGRTSGHVAQDDWAAGDVRLGDGKKIKEYIARTLRDAGDIHGDEGEEAVEDERDLTQDLPLPNIVIDGELVHGDEIAGEREMTEQERALVEFICGSENIGLDLSDSDEE